MHRKIKLFSLILGLAIFAFAGLDTFAQGGTVKGVVKLKQADGKVVPHQGATVQAYRTDIDSGAPPATTTNDKGEFTLLGLGAGQTFAVVVSGEGIAATVQTGIQSGMQNILFEVTPGTGGTYTEAEVRDSIKKSANMTEEERRKAAAEFEKEAQKVKEQNEKAVNTNKIVNDALKNGEAAFKAKKWDEAITHFDLGINADPNFEGTAPVFYNYKGESLKEKAFASYRRSTADPANKATELAQAKEEFLGAIASFDKGLEVIKNATTKDPSTLANMAINHRNLLASAVESYRLIVMTRADVSKAPDGIPVFEQYFTVEKDPAAILKARVILGDILRENGDSEGAIKAYRGALEADPNNADSLAGIGLSLFSLGVAESSKEKMQEGLNFMQQFADKAPDTHPLKASVRDAVDYLVNEEKLAPQKAPARRRN